MLRFSGLCQSPPPSILRSIAHGTAAVLPLSPCLNSLLAVGHDCSLGEPMNPLTEKHKYSKAALKKKKKVLKNNTGYSTALLFFFFMLLCSERKAVLRELAGCI